MPQIEVSLRVVRFEFEDPAIGGNGILSLPQLGQRGAQVITGRQVFGSKFERAAIRGYGIVELTTFP